jgi:hypothetical protein
MATAVPPDIIGCDKLRVAVVSPAPSDVGLRIALGCRLVLKPGMQPAVTTAVE